MLTQRHLNLQCVHLGISQEWAHQGAHLSFIFPKAGAGKWLAGGSSQRLASGDVLVLDATLGGKVCAANAWKLDFWCFSVHLEHLFPLLETSEICRLQCISEGFKTVKLYPAASAMAQECHRRLAEMPAQVSLDYRSRLLQIAAAVLTDEFSHARIGRAAFVPPTEHLMQLFTKLTAVELLGSSIEELAKKCGCGPRHLNRLFHHYFGISVAALKMEMRLLRSVTLLRDPDAKVMQVAEACGFRQLGPFNFNFKRRFGLSPREWRKRNLTSDTSPNASGPDAPACPLQINGFCSLPGTRNNSRAGFQPKGRLGAYA